jgi:SAM-dependent methyltransferase
MRSMPVVITDRYDRHALRYGRWWGPVLEPTALALLGRVAASLATPPDRVLDVGTGIGVLAIDAARRWPGATIIGLDGSAGMLGVANGQAVRRLPAEGRSRLEWATGLAERLPFADGHFDLVVSSFVYQLVPDRGRALREAFRVLRPGGTLGYVTWLEGEDDFAPQRVFEDLVDDEALDEGGEFDDGRSGDVPSLAACAAQLRRAGFRRVQARGDVLAHRWTAGSYLRFLERYEAADLFGSLPAADRARLRRLTAERLAALAPAEFEWRVPVVHAVGRKPARPADPAGRVGAVD